MKLDLERHPCFSKTACKTARRIHLPVAPVCNIQCNFCNRKFDCVNESRPGVCSSLLSPKQALEYFSRVHEKTPMDVVGIAGPGDPFANSDSTLETLRLIRENYSEVLLCVSSNGLELAPWVDSLAELKVSHATVTLNAVNPLIGSQIYSWVRYKKRVYRGQQAAEILLNAQLESIKALKERDLIVKINTIIIPGINDKHVMDIANKVKDLGADIMNCIGFIPVEETAFADIEAPDNSYIVDIRKKVKGLLPQMEHCMRCRADAVGKLGDGTPDKYMKLLNKISSGSTGSSEYRPYVAVATREGVLINQHLGEARELYIYGLKDGELEFVEKRKTPPEGGGSERWNVLADLLEDCKYLLCGGIGESPEKVFKEKGLKTMILEGVLHEAAFKILKGESIDYLSKRCEFKCGSSCSGSALGCG